MRCPRIRGHCAACCLESEFRLRQPDVWSAFRPVQRSV